VRALVLGAPATQLSWRRGHPIDIRALDLSPAQQATLFFLLSATAPRSVHVIFVDKAGKETPASGRAGQNLLHIAHENGVELEGACECSLACSTCHVILEEAQYGALEPPTDEEEDLLDLAFGLTPTCVVGGRGGEVVRGRVRPLQRALACPLHCCCHRRPLPRMCAAPGSAAR
jgi:2Fe-2S ferredoxin